MRAVRSAKREAFGGEWDGEISENPLFRVHCERGSALAIPVARDTLSAGYGSLDGPRVARWYSVSSLRCSVAAPDSPPTLANY